ncbi:cold-shock protein [Curtobacterium pusillum]|uniref:cold-shock protein n=1 Tax=Curtobacterium pusillum TaxID=69373 RepID=UPI0016431788|nr:cold shock domain-containing protein [Curtobacterium pusillum]
MRNVEGECVWWSDENGRGALRSDDVASEVFVHFANLRMTGFHTLLPGERVRFDVEPYPSGQDGYFFRAHDVTPI